MKSELLHLTVGFLKNLVAGCYSGFLRIDVNAHCGSNSLQEFASAVAGSRLVAEPRKSKIATGGKNVEFR
jgi:hypothetical protein